jgi:ssRNA-specific RNase YbeY (16S rRNA maturation enzyme)
LENRGAEGLYVGDIAVAYQFTAKEAKAEGKPLLDHVTHL